MRAQTVNRLTAGLATGVFLILSVVLANLSTPQQSDTLLRRPSTFFTDPSGARALLLVTQRFFPAAEQWRRSLHFLPGPPEAGSLVIAGPQRSLSEREAERLEQWLDRGGQLILLTADGWTMRRRASSEKNHSEESGGGRGGPAVPTFLERWEPSLAWTRADQQMHTGRGSGVSIGNEEVNLGWHRSFSATGAARVIATANNAPLAVEIPAGRGRIVAVADPTMATNGVLRRSDNAVWLVTLLAGGSGGKILFDEYHHGFGEKRGAIELTQAFFATPWGWCVLQLAATGLLYVFLYRRRFGRIREPLAFERNSPLERIEARAGVFRAAGAQRLAGDLIVQHLCQSLGRTRSRVADSARLEHELDNVLRRHAPASGGTLRDLFGKMQQGTRLSDAEFTELGKTAGEIIEGSKP